MNIEPLEPRIAPASVSVVYTDVDGDLVKITASRGGTIAPPFDATDLVFVGGGSSGQLATLDLTDPGFGGASIVFKVSKKPGGDGRAHVGFIDATGVDLDRVVIPGDLGKINAGDAITANDAGLNLLQVRTMGTLGLVTQGGAGNLETVIFGKLGALKVAGDFTDSNFFVTTPPGNSADGQIGSIFIGGDLNGGTLLNSGKIQSSGRTGTVRVVGDIVGSTGDLSGRISANGMGNVQIGGDVIGGAGGQSGAVESSDGMGQVQIGGDLVLGAGALSGSVASSFRSIGDVRIGGDLSGRVRGSSGLGDVHIGGDLTGSIENFGSSAMGNVQIGGDVRGGEAGSTGVVQSLGGMGNVRIGGDVVGGTALNTGAVRASQGIGHVRIGGDLIGGSIANDASLSNSGLISADSGRIGSVTIGGSLIAGTDASTGSLNLCGAIVAGDDLGPVKIGGSILGNSENPALIIAAGQAVKPAAGFDTAIASLTVGGDARFAKILAGFGFFNQIPVNADASIGKVSIGRDWVASSIVAGAQDAGAPGFGIGDTLQAFGNTALVARIASITIKGDVTGSLADGDHFGFVAQQIDKLKIGARTFILAPGPSSPADNFLIPFTDDVRVLEV